MSATVAVFVKVLGSAGVRVLVGMLAFVLAYGVLERVLPFSITRELGQKRNPAVAVLMLSLLLGLGIIVAAAAPAPASVASAASASASAPSTAPAPSAGP